MYGHLGQLLQRRQPRRRLDGSRPRGGRLEGLAEELSALGGQESLAATLSSRDWLLLAFLTTGLGDDVVELIEADGGIRPYTACPSTIGTFGFSKNDRRRRPRSETSAVAAEHWRTSRRSSGDEGGATVELVGRVETACCPAPEVGGGGAGVDDGSLPEIGEAGGGRSALVAVVRLGRFLGASLDRRRQQGRTPFNESI